MLSRRLAGWLALGDKPADSDEAEFLFWLCSRAAAEAGLSMIFFGAALMAA